MIVRPFALVLSACFAGVVFSCAASILHVQQAIDPLSAAGLIFSLGVGGVFLIVLARLLLGAALLILATGLLVAPVVRWIPEFLRDPLGRRAQSLERALIDRLYPPHSPVRRCHVQA